MARYDANNDVQDDTPEWGCYNSVAVSGARDAGIYAGQANTAAILAACSDTGSAARAASAYTFGGKSDWYLPSSGEAQLIYEQKVTLFPTTYNTNFNYWTSTEVGATTNQAYIMSFNTGIGTYPKYGDNAFHVRPVRQF